MPFVKSLADSSSGTIAPNLVMVGEQAQEMQLAHWLPTTTMPRLARIIPSWAQLWLAVFPTVETMIAQAAAAVIVLGSFGFARRAR